MRTRTSIVGPVFVLAIAAIACGQDAKTTTISVDSPAFVFSPGNWVDDEGRGGSLFRQT